MAKRKRQTDSDTDCRLRGLKRIPSNGDPSSPGESTLAPLDHDVRHRRRALTENPTFRTPVSFVSVGPICHASEADTILLHALRAYLSHAP